VLSWFPSSIVWRRLLFGSIIYVMSMGRLSHDDHVSRSHFPFSQGLVLRCWGCVLLFSCLLLGYLLCRRVTFVTCRDWESCWLFFCSQKFWFLFENYVYVLWWDYSQRPSRSYQFRCIYTNMDIFLSVDISNSIHHFIRPPFLSGFFVLFVGE